jgi:hypothetical protein
VNVTNPARVFRGFCIGGFFVLSACSAHSNNSVVVGYDAQVVSDIDRLRAATRPFLAIDSAVAAGYPREVPDCLVHEHHGAMGYHHVNRTYVDARSTSSALRFSSTNAFRTGSTA